MLLFDGKPYLMILALATAVYTSICNLLNYNGLYLWGRKFPALDGEVAIYCRAWRAAAFKRCRSAALANG